MEARGAGGNRSTRRLDIRVHAHQVGRVVLLLDFDEPFIVFTIIGVCPGGIFVVQIHIVAVSEFL